MSIIPKKAFIGAKESMRIRIEVSKDWIICYPGYLWTAVAKKWIVDPKTKEQGLANPSL